MRTLWPRLLIGIATAIVAWPASADTIKVLTAGAFKQVAVAMVSAFEARTGHKVIVDNDTAGALAKRIAGGEGFDVVVLTPAALKPLADGAHLDAGRITPLAAVGLGVAVKSGAKLPAVETVEQFRQALLDAKHVAYIDPASGGSSGPYVEKLFAQLGVADAVRAKAVLVPGGLVAQKLVTGEADLALHQISEILPVAGVTFVAALPAAVQNYTTYAGAVSAKSAHAAAARAFVEWLAGPQAEEPLRAKGMLPPQ